MRTLDTLRPALLVTWALPAERVRSRVPAPLQLDTIRGEDGGDLALLSVAAVRNVRARPAIFPWAALTYEQANYRTYVTLDGKAGVLFFANFVGSRLALLAHRLLTPNSFHAPARLSYTWQRRAGVPTSWRMRFRMSSALGQTRFDAHGRFIPPQTSLLGAHKEASFFISHRLDGYYRTHGGGLGRLSVEHAEMEPWGGTLREIRADPWLEWSLLSPAEIADPLAVMLQHEVLFTGLAPRRVA